MPKKTRKIAPVAPALRTKKRRRAATRSRMRESASELKSNPGAFTDLMELILPGFAGYAATRFVSRIAYVQLSQKWPRAAPHLAVGSSAAMAAAAWFLAPRWKKTEQYHMPLLMGASIAAAQQVVQTYLPKFGWMVSDVQADSLPGAARAPIASGPIDDSVEDDLEDVDMDDVGSLSGPTVAYGDEADGMGDDDD